MHAQIRTSGPLHGRRVVITMVLAALVSLAALAGMASTARAADEQGQNLFAAIAVDRTDGTYGFGFNYATRALAQRRALTECRVRSRNGQCRQVVWVQNGCAVVFVRRGSSGGISRIAWAVNRTKSGAQIRAKGLCGPTCRQLAFTCTRR